MHIHMHIHIYIYICVYVHKFMYIYVKQARHDKQKWTLERLQDLRDVRTSWCNIKFEKKALTPNSYNMKDIHGNRIPIKKNVRLGAVPVPKTVDACTEPETCASTSMSDYSNKSRHDTSRTFRQMKLVQPYDPGKPRKPRSLMVQPQNCSNILMRKMSRTSQTVRIPRGLRSMSQMISLHHR